MKQIEYNAEYGKIAYPEGFADKLSGLSIAQQMKYFRLGNCLYLKTNYELRKKSPYYYTCSLEEDENVEAVIVHNDMIAGVWVWDQERNKQVACMPEKDFCCYFEEEIDGCGIKEVKQYIALICVGDDFD